MCAVDETWNRNACTEIWLSIGNHTSFFTTGSLKRRMVIWIKGSQLLFQNHLKILSFFESSWNLFSGIVDINYDQEAGLYLMIPNDLWCFFRRFNESMLKCAVDTGSRVHNLKVNLFLEKCTRNVSMSSLCWWLFTVQSWKGSWNLQRRRFLLKWRNSLKWLWKDMILGVIGGDLAYVCMIPLSNGHTQIATLKWGYMNNTFVVNAQIEDILSLRSQKKAFSS